MEHVHENLAPLNNQAEGKDESKGMENRKVRISYYAISTFLILFSSLFLFVSMNMENHSRTKELITPAAFPGVLSTLLLILGIVLFIQTAIKKYDRHVESHSSEETEEDQLSLQESEEEEETWQYRWGKSPVAFMVMSTVYLLLIPKVGFMVTTAVFLFFCLYLIGIISWMQRILLVIGTLLFAYFVFVDLLLIRLPVGPWGF